MTGTSTAWCRIARGGAGSGRPASAKPVERRGSSSSASANVLRPRSRDRSSSISSLTISSSKSDGSTMAPTPASSSRAGRVEVAGQRARGRRHERRAQRQAQVRRYARSTVMTRRLLRRRAGGAVGVGGTAGRPAVDRAGRCAACRPAARSSASARRCRPGRGAASSAARSGCVRASDGEAGLARRRSRPPGSTALGVELERLAARRLGWGGTGTAASSPLATASFWWVIDVDMSMPWAMQVL